MAATATTTTTVRLYNCNLGNILDASLGGAFSWPERNYAPELKRRANLRSERHKLRGTKLVSQRRRRRRPAGGATNDNNNDGGPDDDDDADDGDAEMHLRSPANTCLSCIIIIITDNNIMGLARRNQRRHHASHPPRPPLAPICCSSSPCA